MRILLGEPAHERGREGARAQRGLEVGRGREELVAGAEQQVHGHRGRSLELLPVELGDAPDQGRARPILARKGPTKPSARSHDKGESRAPRPGEAEDLLRGDPRAPQDEPAHPALLRQDRQDRVDRHDRAGPRLARGERQRHRAARRVTDEVVAAGRTANAEGVEQAVREPLAGREALRRSLEGIVAEEERRHDARSAQALRELGQERLVVRRPAEEAVQEDDRARAVRAGARSPPPDGHRLARDLDLLHPAAPSLALGGPGPSASPRGA